MTLKSERIFFRKAKSHGIVKQVREKYIRDDIPCLMDGCTQCCNEQPQLLDEKAPFYIIPDLSVILKYLEILEHEDIMNVIISQTIMVNLDQHDKSKTYRRLRQILNDPRHSSILFYNEIFAGTTQQRKPDESKETYNWRCHLALASWFQQHTQHPIVLLSEFQGQCNSPLANGQIRTLSMQQFLNIYYPDHELLQSLVQVLADVTLEDDWDRIHLGKANASSSPDNHGYVEYKSMDELDVGIKSGRYFSGILRCSSDRQQAQVSVDQEDSILIIGNDNQNRAVHGDLVVVELLPQSQWTSSFNRVSHGPNQQDDAGDGESSNQKRKTGKIIGVLNRNWRPYVATIQNDETGSGSFHLAIPLDPTIPKIRIRYQNSHLINNQRIVVRIDHWPVNSQYPNGHFVRSLGPIHQLDTEMSAILVEHGISVSQATKAFSEASIKEMPIDTPEQPWTPSNEQIARRRDLRSLTVFSIDPPNCQDIDDALSVETLNDGKLQLGVHIADVTYFVNENSKTDLEARARGTTVYLADRRFDMLPSVLSEKVCSLRHHVDRYAVSVLWTLDASLNVVDTWFGRTLIRSACEMEYEQAQELLNGQAKATGLDIQLCRRLQPKVQLLAKILRVFRERRTQQGGLELASAEVKFKIMNKDQVTDVIPKGELEIHGLVAEAMILANAAVGRRVYEGFRKSALLRHHPAPGNHKFRQLIQAAATKGFTIDFSSNGALAKSLHVIGQSCQDNPNMEQMFKTMATFAMNEAGYISSGRFNVDQYSHYGLALDFYTHFTSPIRRYADVVVHRQLLMVIGDVSAKEADAGATSAMYHDTKLTEICDNLNIRSRESKLAQRDSMELFQAMYVIQHSQGVPLVKQGIICELRSNGFYVFVPSLGLKGPVFLKDKDDNVIIPLSLISDKVGDDEQNIPGCTLETQVPNNLTVHGATLPRSIQFKLFDQVRVILKIRMSHAHRHTVHMSLLGFQETPLPLKRLTNKGMVSAILENLDPATAAISPPKSSPLSQDEIKTRRLIKKQHNNMYSVIESFRQLTITENTLT
ncbi:RNB-domain-containing protein [Hesseltinella vesiculosa]|uniref:DIS3-like exonuclease 1 n=1 Tax=Hesseltinella vesiculosa TaxID=101127 RepID=A0A1X2G6J2_9FUNG|nr:RNB-domain-containing protein [Hesseltinella vesiculosa]